MSTVSAERSDGEFRPPRTVLRLLERMPWPAGYLGRLSVLAAVAGCVPVAMLFAITLARPDLLGAGPAFRAAAFACEFGGIGIAVLCMRAAFRPLRDSIEALRAYSRHGHVPDARASGPGELGALMREMRHIIVSAESTHAELLHRAETDPLTAIANRRKFLALGEDAVRRSRRRGDPLALAVFDIDRFKAVNDTYGHAAGDAVLRMVAGLIERRLRDSDVFARLGGEEFAILLARATLPDGLRIAEALRQAIAALPMPALDGATVTASFGVTVHDPADSRFEMLLDRADRALYDAKRAGRDRVAYRLAVDDEPARPERGGDVAAAKPASGAGRAPVWLVD